MKCPQCNVTSQANVCRSQYILYYVSSNQTQTYYSINQENKSTIQINQTTRCKNFSGSLLDVYVQLNMFRASSRPSSVAQQLQ
jgi:hypothetical protein